jgi:hypothetical protein
MRVAAWIVCGFAVLAAVGLVVGEIAGRTGTPAASTAAAPASGIRPDASVRCSTGETRIVSDQMAPIFAKWTDEYTLAQNAPRISLTGVIGQMQDTRRAYAAVPSPACYAAARARYLASMDDAIAGFTAFLGEQDQSVIQADFQKAQQDLAAGNTASDAAKPQ